MQVVSLYNQKQIKASNKVIPNFKAGDTLVVHVTLKDGAAERIQSFEGICIGRHNNSISSTFTVRKVSHGEGVERTFQLYSPLIQKMEVIRRGKVRRSKLYYLRALRGKASRIKEARRTTP